jgi:DNA-binding IclR family transcriptional regulator
MILAETRVAGSNGLPPLDRSPWNQLVEIRRRGFAVTRSSHPSRLNGIAVPILWGEQVLGAVSLRYPKSAMT